MNDSKEAVKRKINYCHFDLQECRIPELIRVHSSNLKRFHDFITHPLHLNVNYITNIISKRNYA